MKSVISTKNLSHADWLRYRTMGIGGSDVSQLSPELIPTSRYISSGWKKQGRQNLMKVKMNIPISVRCLNLLSAESSWKEQA